jgi:hypothetical protein
MTLTDWNELYRRTYDAYTCASFPKTQHTPTSHNIMTTTRKHLRINITGESFYDLEVALDEVKKKIEEEYLSGFDSNETGDYKFDITDYIAESVK